MIINAETHPCILEAMHCIEGETGSTLRVPVKEVPDRWKPFLADIEFVLSQLSRKERAPEAAPLPAHVKPDLLFDNEFYEFCNGQFDAVLAMSMRTPMHTAADIFLVDFSEEWTYTEDEGERTINRLALSKRVEYLEMLRRESGLGLTTSQENELNRLRLFVTA